MTHREIAGLIYLGVALAVIGAMSWGVHRINSDARKKLDKTQRKKNHRR